MKFTRIQVDRFGPIIGLDTAEGGPLPGFIAVEGPNEAGKSAFHHLLSSLLFGFYPATRDQNPFTPWEGGDIEAHADIEMDDGARWELHRRLLSSPRGELVRGDHVETLDNRSLPGFDQVDLKIYQQVYAISGTEISQVASEAWDAVRDQLVIGMGSQDLRAPREVIDEWRVSGDQLWRSTNRGNHRHKALRAEIQRWILQRSEAEARDRQLREMLQRLRVLDVELEELRERRTEAAARLERLRELHRYRTRLSTIDDLADELGEVDGLDDLPNDPAARFRDLTEREHERIREARATEALELRLREVAADIVHDEPGHNLAVPELAASFRALSISQLRERVFGLEEERRRLEGLQDQLATLSAQDIPEPAPLPRWAIVTASLGTVLIVVGAILRAAPSWIIGTVLLVAAIPSLLTSWTHRARVEGRMEAQRVAGEELRLRIPEVQSRVVALTGRVHELMEPLSLKASASVRPSLALVDQLSELARLLREWESRPSPEGDQSPIQLQELEEALRRAGGDGTPDGLRTVVDRLERWRELQRARADLQREAGDLDALRSRLGVVGAEGENGDDGGDGPLRRATEHTLLDEIDQEIYDRRDERSELRERVRALTEETTVDLVDGRIQTLRDELSEVEVERDRHFVRARLLERAEARFRAAHQPDLLRRAEGYLRAVTEERYHRLLIGQPDSPHDVQLQAAHLPRPTPVDFPLSTGTREQVYFALRLAIVDHLDRGREPLPLLLDEALVNWDPERRALGLDLLLEISGSRQIFLFTCHPHIAEEVATRGGRVLQLGPARARGAQEAV